MIKPVLVSLFALSALAFPVRAEDASAKSEAGTDACLKAVTALGASMGQTEVKAPDGRTLIKYRLRTSGLDYDATCDAATGVVGDVTPHVAPSGDGAS